MERVDMRATWFQMPGHDEPGDDPQLLIDRWGNRSLWHPHRYEVTCTIWSVITVRVYEPGVEESLQWVDLGSTFADVCR